MVDHALFAHPEKAGFSNAEDKVTEYDLHEFVLTIMHVYSLQSKGGLVITSVNPKIHPINE
jgi:hypothetical protein